jgi:hypothetical protein
LGKPAIRFHPLIVVTSSETIIDNCSDIFTQSSLRFLIPYIALIETKLTLDPIDRERRDELACSG